MKLWAHICTLLLCGGGDRKDEREGRSPSTSTWASNTAFPGLPWGQTWGAEAGLGVPSTCLLPERVTPGPGSPHPMPFKAGWCPAEGRVLTAMVTLRAAACPCPRAPWGQGAPLLSAALVQQVLAVDWIYPKPRPTCLPRHGRELEQEGSVQEPAPGGRRYRPPWVCSESTASRMSRGVGARSVLHHSGPRGAL